MVNLYVMIIIVDILYLFLTKSKNMNTVKLALMQKAPDLFVFKPRQKGLYKTLGIGQKRMGQILRNEKSATIDETKAISAHFKIPVGDLLNIKKVS